MCAMTWAGASESGTRITVAGLIEGRVSLRWHEAVAIVLEIADLFQRSGRHSIPPRTAVSLTPAGTVELGDESQSSDPVTALADTLGALLPLLPKEPPTQLQLIASTAGPDSVSYKSVDEFAEALGYFERPGRTRILAEVYRRALEVRHPERGAEPSLPPSTATLPESSPIQMLQTQDIVTHEAIDTGDIRQLVESVRQFGVLQPLLVRPFGPGYEVVAGARRFAAAKAAGLTELPCRVVDVDDEEPHPVSELPERKPVAESLRDEDRPLPKSAFPGQEVDRSPWDVEHDARDVEPPAPDVDRTPDMVLGPALGEIADSLRAATSCWRLSVEGPDRPYSRTVNEVTRAELQRATWVVEALQLLTQRPVVAKARVNVGTVLEQVFRATEPERRLAHVKLAASLAEASIVVRGDERLLVMAVGSVLQALVAMVSETPSATIRCSVSSKPGAAAIELSQDAVRVPPSLRERFFDETWHGRPGGYSSAVGLAAARRVFELHGGTTRVDSDDEGCRLVLTLPA